MVPVIRDEITGDILGYVSKNGLFVRSRAGAAELGDDPVGILRDMFRHDYRMLAAFPAPWEQGLVTRLSFE